MDKIEYGLHTRSMTKPSDWTSNTEQSLIIRCQRKECSQRQKTRHFSGAKRIKNFVYPPCLIADFSHD